MSPAAEALQPREMGNLHLRQGRLEQAIASFERALEIDPGQPDACNDLGTALLRADRLEQGERCFRQALALNPQHPEALVNLGNLIEERGLLLEAVSLLRRAVACRPDWPEAHLSLGSAYHDLGDLDRAVACYERALELAPDDIRGHVFLGLSLLLQGDWGRGWDEYEWRWRSKAFQASFPDASARRWDGAAFPCRQLLLHAEQGFGDTLQFLRYLPQVKALGGDVTLRCQQPLARLLQGVAGADRVVGDGESLPSFDLQLPLMSLAQIFGTTPASIPPPSPLTPDPGLVEYWKPHLPRGRLRVGLVWAGNSAKVKNGFRSLPVTALRPLGEMPGLSLIGLQTDECDQAQPLVGMPMAMLGSMLRDFADTAAIVSQLDLVITVDTAMAHLAGALGRPAWILLGAAPDWRWLQRGQASAWYPTARLFRQRQLGDWAPVIDEVLTELRRVLDEGQVVAPSPEAEVQSGDELLSRGEADAAMAHYRRALDLRPAHAPAHWGLGRVQQRQGLLPEATESFGKVMALASGRLAGRARDRLRRIERAYRAALDQPSAAFDARWGLGQVLEGFNRLDEAVACYRAATAVAPTSVRGLVSLGWALMEQCDVSGAIEHLERAITIAPNCAEAHFCLAQALLIIGDLTRGWQEYEWRWRCPALRGLLGVQASSMTPLWRGEDLSGKAILLHCEQGLGDTLQFVRYAPLVGERGGRVIVGCQPELKRLLARMPGVDEAKAAGERMYSPEPLVHAALMSLPSMFGTTLDRIPAGVYLRPEPALVEKWAGTFASEDCLKVGLVWAGGVFNPRNGQRSIAVEALGPLARVSGVAWYGLQPGLAAQVPLGRRAGVTVTNLGARLTDFAETAAVMAHLDLVISVDTAAAHLAGALGRPAWVLLPDTPDWRWLLARDDSPWYPTVRLFRQPRRGDWKPVVEAVAAALAELTERRYRCRQ